MDQAVGIIPARLASTRFPEKVLANRTGRPLIQHVYEAAAASGVLSRIVVAADDERIAAAVRAFRGEVVMTALDHPNGTSRLAEAAAKLGLRDEQLVVNLQGDEPELDPLTVRAAVSALTQAEHAGGSGSVSVGTAAAPLEPAEADNANVVKVVRSLAGQALYFSRARIPHQRDAASSAPALLRHIGIYVYRVAFLRCYVELSPTPLEQAEQLEQLRVLEHGHGIAVGLAQRAHAGIDTPAQYDAFVERWHAGQTGKAMGPIGR